MKMLGKKMSAASKGGRNNSSSTNTATASGETSTASTSGKASGKLAASALTGAYHGTPSGSATTPVAAEPKANYSTHIRINENSKLLPHYSVALSRPHDDSLPADELDPIQAEIEMLLSSVALRYRSLRTEFDCLLDSEDKKQKKNAADKQTNSPGAKRKRVDGPKKAKDYLGQVKLPKLKNNNLSNSPAHSQHTDDSMDAVPYYQSTSATTTSRSEQPNSKVIVPKNDIPNKFWLSVEPYCMPITQEDIKLLDDLIEEYSGSDVLPPIPELGSHYSVQWTTDELRDEQDNSNQNAKANKRFTNASNTDVISMIKKGDKLIGEGITGPLTQRLVAALLEENMAQSEHTGTGDAAIPNESNDSCGENNASSANRSHSSASITSLLRNGVDVEKRLKKELIELGILDASDFAKDKEDEVMNEIKRVRTELCAIAEYNKNELQMLHAAAKEEMKRLEIKRKLDAVDQEIVESYKKVWAAKQKRRPLTKQERQEIFTLVEKQKQLAAQLEMMRTPGFDTVATASTSAAAKKMS